MCAHKYYIETAIIMLFIPVFSELFSSMHNQVVKEMIHTNSKSRELSQINVEQETMARLSRSQWSRRDEDRHLEKAASYWQHISLDSFGVGYL